VRACAAGWLDLMKNEQHLDVRKLCQTLARAENLMGWTSMALPIAAGSERELGDEANRMSAQPLIVAARFADI